MNYLQKNTKSNRLTKTFGLLLFAMSFVLFFSCDKDDDPDMDPDPVVLGKYEVGTFILNEGGFGNNNASISFIDEDGMMTEKIFETETGGIIGDVAQSITFNDDKAYIVVNNSQKIEVVNADDFTSVGRIEGFGSPRYIVPHGDKAFVSNIFENQIDIVDLTSNTITSSLNFECLAENSWDCGFDKMMKAGETIFVVNNDGKKIFAIDAATETIVEQIQLNELPVDMIVNNGDLWVLGSDFGSESGTLYQINSTSKSITKSWEVPVAGTYSNYLFALDNIPYLATSNIAKLNIDGDNLSYEIVKEGGFTSLYGIGVDETVTPAEIYVADALDYAQKGTVTRLNSETFEAIETMSAGVVPSKFYFK